MLATPMRCATAVYVQPAASCLAPASRAVVSCPATQGRLNRQQRPSRQRAAARIAAAAVAAAGGSSRPTVPSQLQQEQPVLDWLVRRHDTSPACLKVERRYVDEDVGYCLVATADIESEEVILSVPLTAGITSEGVDESKWSTHMALQLLRLQAQAADAAAAGDAAALATSVQPWLDALPAHVDLPWLYWSEEEMAELQDEDTVAEAQQLRAVYEDACQEVEGRYSRQQVAWALSQVHSRSFVTAGSHVWVPGIDLCNHTLQPNADIRCIHSPGSCQGVDALEEVCPPATAAVQSQEPSRFELVAGEEGIAAGQEVTISYGSWPSDVLLLFFGFAPSFNPHDSAVLFYDIFDLASFKQRLVDTPGGSEEAAWARVVEAVQQLEAQLGPQAQFYRMVATAAGIDSRLLQAAEALLLAGRGSSSGQPMSLPAFLRLRCQQLLASYPTSLEEDERVLSELRGGAARLPPHVRLPQFAAAVRYRQGKKRVLHATLEGLPQ